MPPTPADDPLLRQAEKARRRARRQAASAPGNDPARPPPTPTPPATPPDSERLITWWRVQVPLPNAGHLLSWLFVVALAVGLLVAFLPIRFAGLLADPRLEPLLSPALPLVGSTLLLGLGLSIARFRRWRRRLPFALTGWETLVDDPEFGDDQQWRHCTVELHAPDLDPEVAATYHAALVVFADRAQRRHYPSDDASLRRNWTADGLSASGSVNRRVAREIKRLCQGHLARLHRTYGGLGAVHLRVGSTRFQVSRPTGGGAP